MPENIKQRVTISFLISFFVICLSCGKAIYTSYTPDDYALMSSSLPISFYLNQGRFVQGIVYEFINYLGLTIPYTSFAFSILCSNSFLSKVETENKFSERIAWDISKDIQSNNY